MDNMFKVGEIVSRDTKYQRYLVVIEEPWSGDMFYTCNCIVFNNSGKIVSKEVIHRQHKYSAEGEWRKIDKDLFRSLYV